MCTILRHLEEPSSLHQFELVVLYTKYLGVILGSPFTIVLEIPFASFLCHFLCYFLF